MVFSSLSFLLGFMPVFFILYYRLPEREKNAGLLIGSVVFYGLGSWKHPLYLLWLLVSMAVNIKIGQEIQKAGKQGGDPATGNRAAGRGWLRLGLFWNFGFLFAFKYLGFVCENLNGLLGITLWRPQLELPPGVSFYTFQVVSYLFDIRRGASYDTGAGVRVGAFLCMFPQLIAGPIITYGEVERALKKRRHTLARLDRGLREFCIGLGVKVLLANRVGNLWREVGAIGYESLSTPLSWMGIAAFSFQLYFDFYGYSLMAKGLGYMLGMVFPDNFRYPYMARSMTGFWRRWHMTLGQWFRDYIYIPLGGSRKGRAKTFRNLFAVWILTGVWHGASWNYLLWGLLLFVLIALEKLGPGRWLEGSLFWGRVYMLFAIPLTWLVFAVTDLKELWVYLKRLFGLAPAGMAVFGQDYIKYGRNYGFLLALCLLFCTPLPRKLYDRYSHTWVATAGLLAVFWLSVYCLYIGLNDPFLYFQF